eukprot:g308.t1
MRCGELATLLVHPEMAYGEAEIANIPHGSSLHYELELLEISPQVSLAKEDLSPEERLLGASKAKEEGNLRFKVGHFKDASGAYLEALYLLGHEASSDSRAEEGLWSDVLRAAERRSLALACQLNLCQSLLKLEEYQAAMQYADAALELHAGHSKALYRRGLAAMGLGHWASAKADLLAAAKKEPRSGEIRRSLEECQERMAREKSDARDAYGGFLARSPGGSPGPSLAFLYHQSHPFKAHQKEIEVAQQDSEKNTALRQQEESDYSSTHQEYQESIRAIGEALELLKAQKDSEAEAAMAQLKAKLGKKLEAYDFQSQGVVEMLEKLQVKFSEEKEALETLETSKKSSHQQVMDSLAKQVTTASEAQEEKTLFKSKAQQSLATAKTDLEEAESTLAEDQKTAKIESLTAEIQQLQSSVAKLAEDIAEASSQITELSTALSEATRLRSDEKAQNRRTLFEAQAAQEAVTEALKLLQDAFEKSEGISFVQENSKTGVVKLLETVLGDFSRLEAETKAQENAAEQEFKTFKADSNADKASDLLGRIFGWRAPSAPSVPRW